MLMQENQIDEFALKPPLTVKETPVWLQNLVGHSWNWIITVGLRIEK